MCPKNAWEHVYHTVGKQGTELAAAKEDDKEALRSLFEQPYRHTRTSDVKDSHAPLFCCTHIAGSLFTPQNGCDVKFHSITRASGLKHSQSSEQMMMSKVPASWVERGEL